MAAPWTSGRQTLGYAVADTSWDGFSTTAHVWDLRIVNKGEHSTLSWMSEDYTIKYQLVRGVSD